MQSAPAKPWGDWTVKVLHKSSTWIRRLATSERAGARVLCFPHAGAGASAYSGWSRWVEPGIELWGIQLPGREIRIREPLVGDLPTLVAAVTDGLVPELDRPYVFFGHSMGALIAFEVARELRRRNVVQPSGLFVSACRAPHLPSVEPELYDLPEEKFLAALERLDGTPSDLVAEPELRALVIPVLRNDMRLCETHVHKAGRPLDCPVMALGGHSDSRVSQGELAAWRQHTRAAFSLQMFPGSHFYIRDHGADIMRTLCGCLARGQN
jgi:medium-chain acyl-[acyl-carrier-protein] hydrolase